MFTLTKLEDPMVKPHNSLILWHQEPTNLVHETLKCGLCLGLIQFRGQFNLISALTTPCMRRELPLPLCPRGVKPHRDTVVFMGADERLFDGATCNLAAHELR